MGILLWQVGRREEGLQMCEQAQKLFEYVLSPNAKVVAGYVAQMRAALAAVSKPATLPAGQLQMLLENTLAARTSRAEMRAEWQEVLQGLRRFQVKKNNLPEAAFIEALLAVLEGQPASLPEDSPYRPYLAQLLEALAGEIPPTDTLPAETIKMLLNNTLTVKTAMPEKLEEWRQALQGFEAQLQQAGAEGKIHLAFIEALLAVLEGQPASLPEDSPYRPYLAQLLEALARP